MNNKSSFVCNEERIMKYAISLARKGYPGVFPNPPVGAVLVKDGRIIKTGFHKKAGGPHAEKMVLDGLSKEDSQNSTLYVTLEPCNHFGQTAPCTEAILDSGISRVVYGTADPNPEATGGASFLASKGVDIQLSAISSQCYFFLEPWLRWITAKSKTLELFMVLSLNGLMYGNRIFESTNIDHDSSFILDADLLKKILSKIIQTEVHSLSQISVTDAYHAGFQITTPGDLLEALQMFEFLHLHIIRLPLFADISESWQTWDVPEVFGLEKVTRLRNSVYESYSIKKL
jgi:pyrimidine deaminase RibD-like protein